MNYIRLLQLFALTLCVGTLHGASRTPHGPFPPIDGAHSPERPASTRLEGALSQSPHKTHVSRFVDRLIEAGLDLSGFGATPQLQSSRGGSSTELAGASPTPLATSPAPLTEQLLAVNISPRPAPISSPCSGAGRSEEATADRAGASAYAHPQAHRTTKVPSWCRMFLRKIQKAPLEDPVTKPVEVLVPSRLYDLIETIKAELNDWGDKVRDKTITHEDFTLVEPCFNEYYTAIMALVPHARVHKNTSTLPDNEVLELFIEHHITRLKKFADKIMHHGNKLFNTAALTDPVAK